jgi:Tfp pilus assembly protein FimV
VAPSARTESSTTSAAGTSGEKPAAVGPAPAGFAPGVPSIDWHPPMTYPPPAAAVSPAPLGFVAPGTLFAPARHAAYPGRRTGLLITTSSLAVLLLLVSVGFALAFVNRNNAYHKQVTTVKQRDTTIASDLRQLTDLKSKLAAAQAQSQQLQSQIAESAGQVTELQQEKAVLGTCITSINNFFTVVGENGTSAEQASAQTTMESACTAAQKYLD